MNMYDDKILEEFRERNTCIITPEMWLKLMQINRLDRIASSLEAINQSLEALEPLADCVLSNGGASYLNISGTIGTHER